MSTTDTGAPRRTGRWTRIALIASLCLNLLAVGIAAGFLLRQHERDRFYGPGSLYWLVKALPEGRQEAARARVEAQMDDYEALRAAQRAARAESAELLKAETLDEAALRAALAKSRELSAARREMVEATFLGIVLDLPAEDRRVLAESLTKRKRWRERRDRARRDAENQ